MRIGVALRLFDQRIIQFKAGLAVLDTIPDFFGGNEISRREVSQFFRKLDAVSTGRHCGITFTAHPSIRGRADGSLGSGSTGWEGKTRSRISLRDPGDENAEDTDPKRPAPSSDRRILTRHKSNYAPQGVTLELAYREGFFATAALDAETAARRGPGRNAACEARFLELVPKAEQAISYVHYSTTARDHYAPAVFAARKDGGGFSKAEFGRAMRRLLEAGRIRSVPFGPPSRGQRKLVIADPGDGEAS
jgi:RecA-family ATPase